MQLSERFLADLFPESAVVETAVPQLCLDELYDVERAQIVRAVDKRKAEYATARVLARRAFARIGVAATALVNGEDRCPMWPEGVVGSIAHTKGVCAVVVAPREHVVSIGIDVEVDAPVRPELFDKICTPSELAWVAERGGGDADAGRLVKTFFSAKEAFYKCQYPLTRQYLGFHDVEVAMGAAGDTFDLVLLRDAGPIASGERFAGLHRSVAGYVAASVVR